MMFDDPLGGGFRRYVFNFVVARIEKDLSL
jgi:hypothetical protein